MTPQDRLARIKESVARASGWSLADLRFCLERIDELEDALEDVLFRVNQCGKIQCESCLAALQDAQEALEAIRKKGPL